MTRRAAARQAAVGSALLLQLLAGCHHTVPPAPTPPIRYVLDPAWQAGGVWFYPRETFSLDQTGIAEVIGPGHAPLTTDNERYDPAAMAAAMAEVQLPAIASVTNLQTGRQVTVRVNDRGPANPARLIALTPRVAALLGMTGPAPVRVRFDPVLSMALSRQVQGRAGELAIAAAPRGVVQQSALPPLAGAGQEAAHGLTDRPAAAAVEAPGVVVPLRLPEQVSQATADPGVLMIEAGLFTHEESAQRRRRDLDDLGARLVRLSEDGQTSYRVQAGPYGSIAEADGALAQAVREGVTDARIVVELR